MKITLALRRNRLGIWIVVALIAVPYVIFGLYLAYTWWLERPQLTLSSGPEGGIYLNAGQVLARVLNENGFAVDSRGSSGAVENAERIQSGAAQLGFARDGLPDVGSKIRALARLYRSHLQIVVQRKLSVRNASELFAHANTLRAFLGPLRSGTRVVAEAIIKQYGRTPTNFQVLGNSWSLAEASQAMLRGDIDVGFFSVGLGSSALNALAQDDRFVLLDVDRADAIVTALPYFEKTVIPPGSYASSREFPDTAITTIASYELLICSSELSDRRAYQITEALFSHASELMRTFPLLTQLSQVDPEKNFYYPLHPGAASYYRRLTEPPVLSWRLAGVVFTYTVTTSTWFTLFLRRRRVARLVAELRALSDELSTPPQSPVAWQKCRDALDRIRAAAGQLYVAGKVKGDPYESLKESIRICGDQLGRYQSLQEGRAYGDGLRAGVNQADGLMSEGAGTSPSRASTRSGGRSAG